MQAVAKGKDSRKGPNVTGKATGAARAGRPRLVLACCARLATPSHSQEVGGGGQGEGHERAYQQCEPAAAIRRARSAGRRQLDDAQDRGGRGGGGSGRRSG